MRVWLDRGVRSDPQFDRVESWLRGITEQNARTHRWQSRCSGTSDLGPDTLDFVRGESLLQPIVLSAHDERCGQHADPDDGCA